MDALEAILTRRSIRKFTSQIIKDEDLSLLLRAGFAAPSAHNRQPFDFIVVKDEKILNDLASHHPYAKMLPQAGCGIVVCSDNEKQDEMRVLKI
ncbi:nitroreductase family protein [Mycoplasmatota bacterium]|nr:nitroreductase family protein [Mycoplasmatota bacterium]